MTPDGGGGARLNFGEQMRDLELAVLDMGSRAEAMVGDATTALARLDVALARRVMTADEEIDRRDLEIEERCLSILALQQPMAGDLRVIGTVMKIITDLERVGDLAVDLARITLKIDRELGETAFLDLASMSVKARALLRESLEAFARRDLALVADVCLRDEEVDQAYRDLRAIVFERMMERPEDVVVLGWLLMAVHHLERVGDHAVNIAERTGFVVTGRLIKAHEMVTSAP